MVKENYIAYNLMLMEEAAKYTIGMPHDRLFKDILSDEKEFCGFINNFIKNNNEEKLLPENVEKVKSYFITSKFLSEESDLLYKVKNENKYYLVEHQSTIDDSMSFRLLNYCVGILNEATVNRKLRNKDYKIPKIIPIVLYTGDRTWNAKTSLTEKQESLENNGTLIELKYKLIDINKIEESELIKLNTMLSYGMLIEKNKGKEKLLRILNKIAKKCDTRIKGINMQRIIKYILEPVLGEEETEKFLKKFNKIGGEEIMTAIDCLIRDIEIEKEQARKVGLEEGREEGRKEGRNATIMIAKELLRIGIDIKEVCQITKLTEIEIKEFCS